MVVARVGLIVVWVLWACLAWWAEPRQAGDERLSADLAAGRVTSYQTAGSWQQPRFWAAPKGVRWAPDGPILVWTTPNGQTFYATPERPVHDIARQLGFAGVLHRSGPSPLQQTASNIALVLLVMGLVVLLRAPNPVRGTRWFWFWIGQVPLGLGYLAWLLTERPLSNSAPPATRHSGWWGFGLLVVTGIALGALVAGGRYLIGAWLFPG